MSLTNKKKKGRKAPTSFRTNGTLRAALQLSPHIVERRLDAAVNLLNVTQGKYAE